jgi:hypothetical protein
MAAKEFVIIPKQIITITIITTTHNISMPNTGKRTVHKKT